MLTKNFVITRVLICVVFINTQYSLKAMEGYHQQLQKKILYTGRHIHSLGKLASKNVLDHRDDIQDLGKLVCITSEGPALTTISQLIIQKLSSNKAQDEFLHHATINGEPLDKIISNEWALRILKPALGYVWGSANQSLQGISSVTFSPNGSQIVSAAGNDLKVFTRLPDNTWSSPVELIGHNALVSSVVFNFDGSQMISTGLEPTARIWSKQPDNTWKSVELRHNEPWIYSAAFSPNESQIVTGPCGNTPYLWTKQPDNTFTSEVLKSPLTTSPRSIDINSVAFSS